MLTAEILLVFAILLAAIVLFVTDWLRPDLVALLVLITVALAGLVPPADAFAGFSSPAVITVWAMFIISGALTMTGVAQRIGRAVMSVAGTGEARLIVVIMATAGVLSAIMNNVGVAALMLPVVMDMARETGRSPSRLLMPLAFGCLLGGLTTLIGTPPNILVSEALREYGLQPFRFFDFTPVGGVILAAGIAFVAVLGRRLLPERDPGGDASVARDPQRFFDLGDRVFTVRIPPGSPLAGRTLAASRLGSALRLTIIGVLRGGRTMLAPAAGTVLRAGDRLLALGRPDLVADLCEGPVPLVPIDDPRAIDDALERLELLAVSVPDDSPLVGRTLFRARLRSRVGATVLAIRRGDEAMIPTATTAIEAGDVLLIQTAGEPEDAAGENHELGPATRASPEDLRQVYRLHERLLPLRVAPDSRFPGKTLAECRLADGLDLHVWAILRDGETLRPDPDATLRAGDILVADGADKALETVGALRDLEFRHHRVRKLSDLTSDDVGLAEVILSPQTRLDGKTLRELEFRETYGLNVLAVWRRGEVQRTNLRDLELRLGDSFLVHGPKENLRRLARDPDFLIISETVPAAPRPARAPVALLILAAVLTPVILGWVPIAIAAVTGAVLMILTRCLTMEEAYRFIEWRAVFLIAGMLALGAAMEQTGAARVAADAVVSATSGLGLRGVLAGLFVITALTAQVVPTAALAVLMAPIAFNTAVDLGASPLPFMMTIAMATAASLSSPVSHPVNTLIMGPGGYRFIDYVRVGMPLTLVVLVLVVLLVPVVFPFG